MDAALKKGFLVIVVIFLGFYMFTDPAGMASTAKGLFGAIWTGLENLFQALIRFFDTLSN